MVEDKFLTYVSHIALTKGNIDNQKHVKISSWNDGGNVYNKGCDYVKPE